MTTTIYICTLCLILLQACSQSAEEVRATRERNQSREVAAGLASEEQRATAAGDADLVTAVSPVASKTPIELKFRLDGRPQVNQPVSIELVFLPDTAVRITQVSVSVQGGDGVDVTGASRFNIAGSDLTAPVRRELTVRPRQAGVLSLAVTALVDSNTGSIARTYSIPLIAEAPPETPPGV